MHRHKLKPIGPGVGEFRKMNWGISESFKIPGTISECDCGRLFIVPDDSKFATVEVDKCEVTLRGKK